MIMTSLSPSAAHQAPYREHVHRAELAPGLDLTGFNKLADQLEDEAIIGDFARFGDIRWYNPLSG